MKFFQNITLTDVLAPITVFSEKGRTALMTERSSYGISFCISGQITYTFGKTKTVSNPNNAILLPKCATYSLHGDKEGLFPLINFQCDGLCSDSILAFPIRNPKKYIELYKKVSFFSSIKDRLNTLSCCYELFGELDKESEPRLPILSEATALIQDSVSDPALSNQIIATQLGISEVYLRKLFSAHYGISPKQYILNLRLNLAKRLLANTANAITDIAEECGFSSVYHFCRIFKEKTGQAPKEYALSNRVYKL